MRNGEPLLFEDSFNDLTAWVVEGRDTVYARDNHLVLECLGSRQGGVGTHAFCRRDFPDEIAVEFRLRVRRSDGLVITFIALQGRNGEDALSGVPPRDGLFRDYVGDEAAVRSYHVSVSRYNDRGEHTGVSNWRRNPGLHLMGQGEDRCKEIGTAYAIRIEKRGPACSLFVDGKPGPSFVDPMKLPEDIPRRGKVGFRAIGSAVIAEIADFRVVSLA
jgi:hypothetical protein